MSLDCLSVCSTIFKEVLYQMLFEIHVLIDEYIHLLNRVTTQYKIFIYRDVFLFLVDYHDTSSILTNKKFYFVIRQHSAPITLLQLGCVR